LSKEDYIFYKNTSYKSEYIYTFFTNEGNFIQNPPIDLRDKITHLTLQVHLFNYRDLNNISKIENYPKLKYLDYGSDIENLNWKQFNKLKSLILRYAEIYKKELETLPKGLENLIFKISLPFEIKRNIYSEFMLKNLPISIQQIIFIQDTNEDFDTDFFNNLTKKLKTCKIPFGCKMYCVAGTNTVVEIE
jgi:hypothetical protein